MKLIGTKVILIHPFVALFRSSVRFIHPFDADILRVVMFLPDGDHFKSGRHLAQQKMGTISEMVSI